MKKLSKDQLKQRDELDSQLIEKGQAVKDAIDEFNTALTEAYKAVETAQEEYNAAVEAANEFVTEISGEMETYHGERSDTWQEGDAGQAYQSWIDAWSAELDPCELEMPSELDEPDALPGDAPLAQRPEQPE